MLKKQFNLHTHTSLCHHADGTMEDYVLSAIKEKLYCVGFSDHTPLPENIFSKVRMSHEELNFYVNEIDKLTTKYADKILILKGLECEYFPEFHEFHKKNYMNFKLDYLVLGTHYLKIKNKWLSVFSDLKDIHDLKNYSKTIIDSIDSKLFLFIAHPDLFMNSYKKWDKNAEACSKEILCYAEKTGIPLEINGYGFRKKSCKKRNTLTLYPYENFWKLASNYSVKVILNSDAHSPIDIYKGIEDGNLWVEKYRLNLISFEDLLNP